LTIGELEALARQIRRNTLEVVSTSGGHLGPGLGVVELTLALYQTLDLDIDRVAWDVGHQAYPHKLITGRYSQFHTPAQAGRGRGLPETRREPLRPFRCWSCLHQHFGGPGQWPWPVTAVAKTSNAWP